MPVVTQKLPVELQKNTKGTLMGTPCPLFICCNLDGNS